MANQQEEVTMTVHLNSGITMDTPPSCEEKIADPEIVVPAMQIPSMQKQESAFFRPMEECEETRVQYAKVGLDINTFQRFKKLAAALVVEKEAEMARSQLLGNEKDVIMEESIECVPKNFLDEINFWDESKEDQDDEDIRVMSVGELLSLLEV